MMADRAAAWGQPGRAGPLGRTPHGAKRHSATVRGEGSPDPSPPSDRRRNEADAPEKMRDHAIHYADQPDRSELALQSTVSEAPWSTWPVFRRGAAPPP